MDPLSAAIIVFGTIALCAVAFPGKPKAKPKTAKDDLDAAMQKYLKELSKK